MGNESKSTYAIELKNETSGPADAAADSLQKLRAKIEADTKALRAATAGLAKLKAGGLQNSKAADLLRARMVAQKKAIGAAQESYVSLGGTFGEVAKSADDVGSRFGKVGEAIAGVVPVIGGVIAAFAALVVGIIAVGTALARYALSVADARRSESLHLEGMLRMRRAHGLVTASGIEVSSAIDRVADSSGLGRAELEGYASMIARTGVRGGQLAEILDVTAIAASAAGDEAARSFAMQASYAARAGQSVTALGNRWRARFGDVARAQGLSVGRQMTRLRENFSQLFSGLKLDGLLSSLNRVLTMFSQTNVVGRAFRTIINAIFGPALADTDRWATRVQDAIEIATEKALELTVTFLTLRRQLGTWGALTSMLGGALSKAFDGIRTRVTAALDSIPWESIGTRIGTILGSAISTAVVAPMRSGALGHVLSFVTGGAFEADGVHNGRAAMDGAIAGMMSQRFALQRAAMANADSISDAFRVRLQIHSPSRVFARLGAQIPAGIEQGIEDGSRGANDAAASMVSPPSAPSGRAPGGRVAVSIGDIHVHASATQGQPRDIARGIMDELCSLLEGAGIQMGAAT